jgi:hypothetical protein
MVLKMKERLGDHAADIKEMTQKNAVCKIFVRIISRNRGGSESRCMYDMRAF